jgi:hypothetical protein
MATRTARIELISGVAAGVLGLLFWAIWLFAPLHPVNVVGAGYGMQVVYTSQADNTHGLNTLILLPLLILVYLVVTGALAYGAYLHVRRRVPEGRLIVWGGTILTLLLMSASHIEVPVSLAFRPDALVPGLGLGLCAGLAITASLASIGVEDARRQASR